MRLLCWTLEIWRRSQLDKFWRARLGQLLSMFLWPLPGFPSPFLLPDSGSVQINDVEYRWKSKGTGSKVVVSYRRKALGLAPLIPPLQLVDKATNWTVAESHSRIRGNFFRKPRDMNLEISATISLAIDVVLLTFILVWMQRQNEGLKEYPVRSDVGLPPLPAED